MIRSDHTHWFILTHRSEERGGKIRTYLIWLDLVWLGVLSISNSYCTMNTTQSTSSGVDTRVENVIPRLLMNTSEPERPCANLGSKTLPRCPSVMKRVIWRGTSGTSRQFELQWNKVQRVLSLAEMNMLRKLRKLIDFECESITVLTWVPLKLVQY